MTSRDVSEPARRARRLAAALAAAADEIERSCRIPEPLLTALHDSGLFRLLLPARFGGGEADPWIYFEAVAELARHDASVAWNVFVANSTAQLAPYLEPATVQTIYGEPRGLVTWGPPNDTRVAAAPGGYLVSGRWDYASGCRQASWIGVHAQVVEADGGVRRSREGRPVVRTLLFPIQQAELLDTWDAIGLRGTASDSYTVHQVFVPESFSSSREDLSLRREPGRLYAFTWSGLYAVGVAGCAVGVARAMLAALVDLAGHKTPRGQARLADSGPVQAEIARAEARLGAAEAFVVETLTEIAGRAGPERPIDVPDRAAVRLACTLAIDAAIDVADRTYRLAGVDAICPGGPFERRFRDIHTLSQQIQARPAHYEAVGRVLLDTPPAVFF